MRNDFKATNIESNISMFSNNQTDFYTTPYFRPEIIENEN